MPGDDFSGAACKPFTRMDRFAVAHVPDTGEHRADIDPTSQVDQTGFWNPNEVALNGV
jgi:hypothetical protein